MPAGDNKLTNEELNSIDSVCIFCWGLLGDVFIRVPIIEALKRKFPEARFTVIVDPYSMKALENHPACDELYVYSRHKKPVVSYLGRTIKNLIRLRSRKFDLSINLYSGGTSALVSRIINARIRIGFDHTAKLRKANTISVKHPSFCQNWTSAFAVILEPLGIPQTDVRLGTSYFCKDDNRKKVAEFLDDSNARYIAVNLGASDLKKMWPVESYVQLLHKLNLEFKSIPVVFSNPGQEYLTNEFASLYPNKDFIKLERLPFPQEAAVLERCNLIITGDTGLMHLASGVKTPIFAIFLCTRPEPVAPADIAFHACMVELPYDKDECGWPAVSANLSVDTVFDELKEFVSKTLNW